MFNIPAGVDELTYNEPVIESTPLDEELDVFLELTDDTSDVFDDDTTGDLVPATPQILSVISQTIRTDLSGKDVVDVVFDVDPVPGNVTYVLRVTKI